MKTRNEDWFKNICYEEYYDEKFQPLNDADKKQVLNYKYEGEFNHENS